MKNLFKTNLILILLTIFGAFLHFYNLNWGTPYYFHPDERNIANSVIQLEFPKQMNPHFFAYGSLPIYTIYFTGTLINFFSNLIQPTHYNIQPSFDQAIQISRFYSALFATLLIPLLFVIARSIATKQSHQQNSQANIVGLIAAFLITTSIGVIQFAHFGTFEMWLTFFSCLFFWLCLKKITIKNVFLIGVVFGILVATKISALVFLPIILFILPTTRTLVLATIKLLLLFLITSALIYIFTNPYVFSDPKDFFSSMNYESRVVLGTLPIFYTGEFFNTTPIIFQFTKIYPFIINPFITFLFIPSFFYFCVYSIKIKYKPYFLLNTFYLILFLSQVFFFAKWTRYMIPTLPFIYLIIALFLYNLKSKINQLFYKITLIVIFLINILFTFAYFKAVFIETDTRIAALQFAEKNINSNSKILSEVYDLGIITFNNNFPNIKLFNFYNLDQDPTSTFTLSQELKTTDYIILPSQRLLKTRLINKNKFPEGYLFYQNLIDGKLGFQKIYETPCDLFCKITYLGDPIFSFEQTANVFDRPEIIIYKNKLK